MTDTVRSADGTTIAFDRTGDGPPLILVSGAMGTRAHAADLAAVLATTFTVFAYDRRGRGDSGDTQPYAVEREIEDLDAVIGAAGGSAGSRCSPSAPRRANPRAGGSGEAGDRTPRRGPGGLVRSHGLSRPTGRRPGPAP